MRHLRSDYDVVQDVARLLEEGVLAFGPAATDDDRARFSQPPLSIPADEPVFLLRSRDLAAGPTVAFWAERAALHDADPRMVEAVRSRYAVEMMDWGRQNGHKVPDVPPGAIPGIPPAGPVLPVPPIRLGPGHGGPQPTQPEGGQP